MIKINLNNKIFIIIIILLLFVIYKFYNKKENFNTLTSISQNELNNIKTVFDNLQNTTTINNLNLTGDFNFKTFKGIIVTWSGPISKIPSGWGLCDGTVYTALDGSKLPSPDLRSKFILGASKPNTSTNGYVDGWGPKGQPSYPGLPLTPRQVKDQGGEETHQLKWYEMPKHNHSFTNVLTWHDGVHGSIESGNGATNVWEASGITGSYAPHNNMPPYYALAFIIKL